MLARVDEVIDAEIGNRLQEVLSERALASNVLNPSRIGEIRHRMEEALSRKLQPGFIEAFFSAALDDLGGRMASREAGRFEITRVPAIVRSRDREIAAGGPLQSVYERVTFDKDRVTLEREGEIGIRAELLSPGHPLLRATIATVLDRYGSSLSDGTTFVDPTDSSDVPRVLIYLQHTITDGRHERGDRKPVSRRFQFVEVTERVEIIDPGAEPYLNYDPASPEVRALLGDLDVAWADDGIEQTARAWATANLASPHFAEVEEITVARLDRTRRAVEQRLDSEIRYYDARAAELKQKELHGKNPRQNSGRARQRADDLEARKARRLRELDIEADLVNHAPTVAAAALVIPQGLIDRLTGSSITVIDQDVIKETDRRAVAAVMAVERSLGRLPVEQDHNNPGFDILSEDPDTGMIYQIEVKGHRPANPEVKVRARQVRQAKQNPERFRLAVVLVPNEPEDEPRVSYFVRPFDTFEMHFAQTYVPLNVVELMPTALEPQ